MHQIRARRTRRQRQDLSRRGRLGVPSAVSAVTVLAALVLAGCSASDGASAAADAATGTPTTEPSGSEVGAVTDAETCSAVGDVLSIIFNADLAVRQDRMSSQEQAGWYRLATRVLARVPTSGEGPVSDSVAALQAAAPALELTAYGTAPIGSEEWNAAMTTLNKACADAGSVLATTSFTGG